MYKISLQYILRLCHSHGATVFSFNLYKWYKSDKQLASGKRYVPHCATKAENNLRVQLLIGINIFSVM